MNKLRIIIADDERPAREFLKAVLRDFEDVEIVGEAENGAEAVEIIKQTKPDLALLDLQMPEVSGLEAVKLLRKNADAARRFRHGLRRIRGAGV
jgi:YesN/AraC family two-component response regulator